MPTAWMVVIWDVKAKSEVKKMVQKGKLKDNLLPRICLGQGGVESKYFC